MSTTTLGIRYTNPGDDTKVQAIDDRALRDQLVVDLLREGATAEPVTIRTEVEVDHTAAAKLRADAARTDVLHIAQLVFEDETPFDSAVADLAEYSPLPEEEIAERLRVLVDELAWQAKVEARDYDTAMCAPGEDHQALVEDADRRVEDAANALIGGAR